MALRRVTGPWRSDQAATTPVSRSEGGAPPGVQRAGPLSLARFSDFRERREEYFVAERDRRSL